MRNSMFFCSYSVWSRHFLSFFLLFSTIVSAAGLEDPQGYAKNSSLQWNWALQAIEKYPWSHAERVLDIGCGDGKISALIAEKYTKGPVIGMDISPAMVCYASSSFPSNTHPNLLFQKGDISMLPFYEQFDLIVSFCSLHYVVEQEKGLQHIHESLRPEGKLLVVVPGKDNTSVANISETLVKLEKWAYLFPAFKKQRIYFTAEEYKILLAECGFEPLSFDITHDQISFSDRSALIDWLRPIVNYISHLSLDLQEEFLWDLSSMMLLSALPTQNGSILLESTMFEHLYQKRK